MSTTPDTPVDYLQVPTNRRLRRLGRHRASTLMEQSNQLNEYTGSNLSLPTSRSGILKKSNSFHQHSPISPRSTVHYPAMNTNYEDDIELSPSRTNPFVELSSPSFIEKNLADTSHENKQRIFKTPEAYGAYALPKKSRWTNPFRQGRSNAENSDAYKIFSILYGLIIFIGGVAFSISHAIIPTEEAENIKYLAEIYFTYLYWMSIFWIIFCIFDIVRHRRRLTINPGTAKTLDSSPDPMQSDNLYSSGNRYLPTLPLGDSPRSPTTPFFSLQLFNDSDEFQSEENDHLHARERGETISSNQTHDDEDNRSLQQDHHRSQSLDNLSTKSSVIMRKNLGPIREFRKRRRALDHNAAHNLRSYVRRRKDSIVQRVIGYNYDDNSTAGGLYIRVGIGIFCLGTVIHSGLSILSSLESLPCARWTLLMDDFSRLLFSFIQFFFIFKHSNLIIRAHESLARLAVMHIVVTNLCVWFRMVVIETTSQIQEESEHEKTIAQLGSGNYSINSSQISMNHHNRLAASPYKCGHNSGFSEETIPFISIGYMRLKPLLYPCTIEFSLMCLTLFFLIWENIGRTFAHKMSDKASTKNVFMVNCHASIKGLFVGMIIFSCTVISFILYAVFRNKIGDDTHHQMSFGTQYDNPHHSRIHSRAAIITTTLANRHNLTLLPPPSSHGPFTSIAHTRKTLLYSIAIVEIVNFCLLSTSLIATIWALMKIRKLQYKRTTTRFDDVLIIVSLTGVYLYSLFSAFALLSNKNHSTWIAYLKIVIVVLEFIEGTVHAFFILVALRKRLNRTNKHQYPAREIITLLIMLDLSLWFEETTTTTKHEANPFQLAFYHIIPWSIIAAIATPLQIFFRFHASVCLSHVWENMYILPVYEAVAPHGL